MSLYYKLLGRDFKLSSTWTQEVKERDGSQKAKEKQNQISEIMQYYFLITSWKQPEEGALELQS